MEDLYLDDERLKKEISRCLQCKEKPCTKACPALCSPCDFIKAAKENDFVQAGAQILQQNPLGEVCGLICPDKFCMKHCLRSRIDKAIRIPAIQATIMHKFYEQNCLKQPNEILENGMKVAVIGFGPAGLGVVSELLKYGFAMTVFEKKASFGGALNLIPEYRLPRRIMAREWQRFMEHPLLEVRFNENCHNYDELLTQGYAAVIVTTGEQKKRCLNISGEELAVDYSEYLQQPKHFATTGAVAVIGGGLTAVDCAITAAKQGANLVEMFVRRGSENMRISEAEHSMLKEYKIRISDFTRPAEIGKGGDDLYLQTIKTCFDADGKLKDASDEKTLRKGWRYIIRALGSVREGDMAEKEGIYYAGDYVNGSSTAVEALASGQNIAREFAKKFSL